ncbi:hypothetical protein KVT40_008300 [Elsinoe batatas]|uniref:Telomerase reverse transcriptase n=1 Tax=Elsinoe batatas TaxID=2601811 RepID=A0A8K0PF89_9PEZI|nr:hypothetical protein KVT40_008300 [Elsinoe batatas]
MKRKRATHSELRARKRAKAGNPAGDSATRALPDAGVLKSYYPIVDTLRTYLRARISKKRGRALQQLCSKDDTAMSALLDTTMVGSFNEPPAEQECAGYLNELKVFSQKRSESATGSTSSSQSPAIQNIVEYCIWLLFRKHSKTPYPPHILCHGYVRSTLAGNNGLELSATTEIPGLICQHPNQYVEKLRSKPWSELPALLGAKAEKILVSLILDCGLYDLLKPSGKNWVQISGTPMTEMPQLGPTTKEPHPIPSNPAGSIKKSLTKERKPNAIRFVRHRMLYGKPVLNSSGKATFGQRPVHVLNRSKEMNEHEETIHVMKYIFPRQFDLHNVFTSTVDKDESAHHFLDYTIREQEIKRQMLKEAAKGGRNPTTNTHCKTKLPKRLRGAPFALVKAIRKRHQTCSYSQLINHYCPTPTHQDSNNILSLATPIAQVSAFCRSAINHVFPSTLWGSPHNHHHLIQFIHHFLTLRRYETLSLHNLLSAFRITSLAWLRPPSIATTAHLSPSDLHARRNLLSSLLYWLIDSFLLPLLSANFYITESSTSRNTLLFFRHDVWQSISLPALHSLKEQMFVPLSAAEVRRMQGRQSLGESKIRLLPKEKGVRPIINLRRRTMVKGRDGKMVLRRSVNGALKPAFAVLNCEKGGRLGASLFSADEVGPRLYAFREGLRRQGREGERLWFVKVDVKGCFDSIPQGKLMGLLREVVGMEGYSVGRYAEGRELRSKAVGVEGRVAWKFRNEAVGAGEEGTLSQMLEEEYGEREGRVFVDKVTRRYESRVKVMEVLREHVERNMVRIGKGVYRQKVGIPQGSVVSSLLCSLFYGDMDRKELEFLDVEECLLMRLIDDFLLITTREDLARRFVKVMHEGMAEYGVTIKQEKSLVNFDITIDGAKVKRMAEVADFPYSGLTINTANLNVSADGTRRQAQDMRAAVTVEHSRLQGQSFYRKALEYVRALCYNSASDTPLQHGETAHAKCTNVDVVQRCDAGAAQSLPGLQSYGVAMRSLPRQHERWTTTRTAINDPSVVPGIVLHVRCWLTGSAGTVEDLIDFAYALMKKKRRVKGLRLDWTCSIIRQEMQRLAYQALLGVFQRRQTKLFIVVEWIRMRLSHMEDGKRKVEGGD